MTSGPAPHPTSVPEVYVRLPHSWCGASLDAVVRVAEAAERLGFDGVSVQDDVLAGPGVAPCGHRHDGDDRTVMESLATLAFVAARTSRVRLLTGVLVLPFRHVVWVAKTAATIDVISSGRLVLGVGVGAARGRQTDGVQNLDPHADISARETALFDLPGPRGALMDEALEALDCLWTADPASYGGRYISFEDVDLVPRPVQQPRPPIWVGGRVDQAIRRAALLADGWFPSQASVEVLAAGRARAGELAAAAGRPAPFVGVNLFAAVDPDGDAARDGLRAPGEPQPRRRAGPPRSAATGRGCTRSSGRRRGRTGYRRPSRQATRAERRDSVKGGSPRGDYRRTRGGLSRSNMWTVSTKRTCFVR